MNGGSIFPISFTAFVLLIFSHFLTKDEFFKVALIGTSLIAKDDKQFFSYFLATFISSFDNSVQTCSPHSELVICFVFWDWVSLCISDWPGTSYVDHDGLKFRETLLSAPWVMRLKVHNTTPGSFFFFLSSRISFILWKFYACNNAPWPYVYQLSYLLPSETGWRFFPPPCYVPRYLFPPISPFLIKEPLSSISASCYNVDWFCWLDSVQVLSGSHSYSELYVQGPCLVQQTVFQSPCWR